MRRFLASLLIMALVLSLLAGCSRDVDEAGARAQRDLRDGLVIALSSEPEEGFDPCTGWGRYGNPLFQSTLIETGKDMESLYDLATDYTISDDGLIWTFKLRKDAYFTDGMQLTAEDVVFTYETAKESGSIVDLTNMEEVYKVDDFTVEFKLHKPDLSIIYTVAATGIVPKHAYGPNYGENPIGSGPYILAQWDKGQQVVMVANENYYGHVPAIKKVTILFLSEDGALAAGWAGRCGLYNPRAGGPGYV
ncbi:MAG: hypothetical protein GX185_07505 [Tissierellia bacterium]|nr:hypothetical protein [Tissierellia bacterium]